MFHKDGNGAVYHAYSTCGRGIDMLNSAYNYVDLARKDAMRATSSSPRPGHGTMTDTTIEQAALSLPPVTRVVALAVD